MKGERKMNEIIVKEASDILKRLSPKNQAYFMTLVRVADAAENGVKKYRMRRQTGNRKNCIKKPPYGGGNGGTKWI